MESEHWSFQQEPAGGTKENYIVEATMIAVEIKFCVLYSQALIYISQCETIDEYYTHTHIDVCGSSANTEIAR